jgi:hypothetical protein
MPEGCSPLGYALLCIYVLLEYWLGKTSRTRAGSALELLVHFIEWVFNRFRRTPMTIDTVPSKRAKELDDVLHLVEDILQSALVGKGVADIQALIPELVQAISGIEQIPDEFKADRRAVLETIGRHSAGMVDTILLYIDSKKVASDPVK